MLSELKSGDEFQGNLTAKVEDTSKYYSVMNQY